MATYDLLCNGCGAQWEVEQPMTALLPRSHSSRAHGPNFVCGPVVQILAPPRTVGVGADASAWAADDRQFDRDAAAYKRLRSDGLQPKNVKGSAIIEAGAETRHEAEHHRIVPDRKLRSRLDRGDDQ